MKFYIITFRSVTYAQRGERVLQEMGIRCTLQRTPRWMEAQGCGYALRIRTQSLDYVLQLLERHQIPIRRIYLQREDGQLEEVAG